tara:strand:- start:1375 stop:1782 length:408 start_codon:yes stop_codon:yes gene_type:complete
MKINGIKKIDIKVIKNNKGDILRFISSKNSFYKKFGEIYFSEIKKDKIKGWNLHTKYTCFLSVLSGSVTFNFDDARKKSKTFKLKEKIVLKKSNYGILIIPPNIWFNFKGNTNNSIIVNALNFPHNKLETKKRNL